MSKGKALIVGLVVICGFAAINFFKSEFAAGQYLTAVVSLITGYFALQVANNGVKGKYWNHEMYHHEHGEKPDAQTN